MSLLVACATLVPATAQTTIQENAPEWYKRFISPSKEAAPWTFWYWMFGCVTDEGVRLDLNAMHDAGIKGCYLMPIKDVSDGPQYKGTARQLSPEWWKRINTAFNTADSLGLQIGIHFSDGFALGGGPWITPEESMQRIVWSDTIVDGGQQEITLPRPDHKHGYYEDIATFAYPADYADDRKPESSVEFPFRSSEPCDIIMSYDEPFTLRSVEVITGGNNYQAHRYKLYASDDGVNYRFIREISPARQGWQNTDAYATYAIPATTARFFKFHWTPEGSDPGSEDMDAAKWKPNLKVANLVLGSEPVIDGYEGKSGKVWRVSKYFPIADNECVPKDKIINLTGKLISSDFLDKPFTINLPKGRWHILRIGHTTTGHINATGGGGRGLECDKFSRTAIKKQFDNWFANIYRHIPQDIAKRVLTRIHVDSWECGSQNWSDNFADEFRRRRGYDLMQWLPLYAGVPIETSEKSEKVLRDIRQTIAELINDIFFDEVATLGKQYGCKLSAECVAPTMVSDGLLHYQHADYPMGEFWLNSPTHDKLNDMLDAVSGAHIYGKDIIQAEGFTEVRGTWDEDLALLKPLLDKNYCTGINAIVFHVNTHNPWIDRAPGMTLDGIGTFFQRDNTWWREMPAFTSYISRCQSLLQYGKPVIDLAVYTGDETPRRSILPERLITSLPGLFSEKTIKREQERLANVGQPLEVSPVKVTHTANMTKAEHWVNPLQGYRYDSFNHDVLGKSQVKNGKLVTPNGMEYSALVIPQARKMNPERIVTCWNTIDSIASWGVPVIKEVWKEADLTSLGIKKDIEIPEGIDYTHRAAKDADIYFLSNQTGGSITFSPGFRAERAYKYLADAVTGKIYKAAESITLPVGGSIFYIMSDGKAPGATEEIKAQSTTVATLDNCQWTIKYEKTGRQTKTSELTDWSKSDINDIKYYSGHADYTTTFRLKRKPKGDIMLDLGNVADIATVYVNGKKCGTAWTAPYAVDITKAVKRGRNTLKIVVVNTWANALQGNDLGTPPFEGIWTNGKYRRAEKELLPAGLLGPVKIVNKH